jgi:tetratricopeptide (TPR) repeat protein
MPRMQRPLCFVLMPFGKKADPTGGDPIDFDRIYECAIRPAIDAAGLDPIRADEERAGGIIHKAMFERLLLCDFAVADLTSANANVFYELGVRHAVRPATTVVIFAKGHAPPFDVNYARGLPYDLGTSNRFPDPEVAALKSALSAKLSDLRAGARAGAVTDSPIFQLLTDYGAPDIDRLKTDTFRDRIEYAAGKKKELARARDDNDRRALEAIDADLGDPSLVEAGVLIDLYLSYRAVGAFEKMVDLYDRLAATLRRAVLVREQLGFALNRMGRHKEALRVLEEVLKEHGPSSETCALIGRVHKDLWKEAEKAGDAARASGHLAQAIDSYVRGFEADFRDAFPGINAVTLLDVQGTPKALAKKSELLPIVRFAVQRRLTEAKADYWDRATLLELAVLAGDEGAARDALSDALATVREAWEPESTDNNLALIRDARKRRGQAEAWLDDIVRSLDPEHVA